MKKGVSVYLKEESYMPRAIEQEEDDTAVGEREFYEIQH